MNDFKINLNVPSLDKKAYIKETSNNQSNFKDVIDKTIKSDIKQKSNKEENNNTKTTSNQDVSDIKEREVSPIEKEITSVVEKVDTAIENESNPEVKEELETLKADLISLIGLINALLNPEYNNKVLANSEELVNADLISLDSSKMDSINVLEHNKLDSLVVDIANMDTTEAKNLVLNIINTLGSEEIKPLVDGLDTEALNETLNKLVMDMEKANPEDTLKDILVKSLASNFESKDKPTLTVTEPVVEEIQIESTKHSFNQSSSENLSSDDGNASNESSQEDEFLSKLIGGDKFSEKLGNVADRMAVRGADSFDKPKVVTKWTASEDMIKNVKFMVRNAVQELKVKIYPKELGEMTIKLLSEEGILKADIRATSKETYNLLNANIQDIKKGLENQGIKIQSVEIGLYSEDTTYFSNEDGLNKQGYNKEEGFNSKSDSESVLDIAEDENLSTIETSLDYLA